MGPCSAAWQRDGGHRWRVRADVVPGWSHGTRLPDARPPRPIARRRLGDTAEELRSRTWGRRADISHDAAGRTSLPVSERAVEQYLPRGARIEGSDASSERRLAGPVRPTGVFVVRPPANALRA